MLTVRCAGCSADVPEDARFCPACGAPVSSFSQMPTNLATPSEIAAARRRTPSPSIGRISSSSLPGEGFAPGTVLAERYRIVGLIGRGGMGIVYEAQQLSLGRRVALKVLHRELTASMGGERFAREIRLLAALQHPHILPLFDSGEHDGAVFYVVPCVEGESLRRRLDRERQLPLEDTLRITRDVADALDHAHRRGVIHRDIKPENILLEEGHAIVADFGVARAITRAVDESQTTAGMAVGTPAYMSPEQASGDRELDGRSDQYSLACVLFEMLAGAPPFSGTSPRAMIARRFTEPPPSLRGQRDVPDSLDRAVRRALAAAPADRFPDVRTFAGALEGGSAAEPVQTRVLVALGSLWRRLRRR